MQKERNKTTYLDDPNKNVLEGNLVLGWNAKEVSYNIYLGFVPKYFITYMTLPKSYLGYKALNVFFLFLDICSFVLKMINK